MYTLIIADDEENLRREIIKKIDWPSIGFQVIGEAENGIEALEQVEQKEPDLLLTDIKMPFISGLELAREVREIRPAMSIAFLTGYDDFKFAQEAIQYNIISYLLKPISAKELTEQMSLIREKMDGRIEELRQAHLPGDASAKRVRTAMFLMPLLLDSAQPAPEGTEEEAEAKLRRAAQEAGVLSMENPHPMFAVLVTMFGEKGRTYCGTGEEQVNFVDETLKKYVLSGSFYSNEKIVSLICASPRELEKYVPIMTKEIVQNAQRIMDCRCHIGVSRSVDRLLDCRSAYLEAMTAVSYSQSEDSDIYFIADIEKEAGTEYAQMEELIDELEQRIKGSDKESLLQFLNGLFSRIERYEGRINAEFLVLQMVTRVYQTVSAVMEEGAADKLLSRVTFFGKILIDDQFDRIRDEATDFCLTARELISSQRKMNSEKLCSQVLSLIQTEFKRPELSIASLSKSLHVSPNYLSTVVKKQTGDTFTSLLTKRRMETAREYLTCTSMKILEISNSCGYTDQHYFSYCFKKYFGISPNKMREASQNAQKAE